MKGIDYRKYRQNALKFSVFISFLSIALTKKVVDMLVKLSLFTFIKLPEI